MDVTILGNADPSLFCNGRPIQDSGAREDEIRAPLAPLVYGKTQYPYGICKMILGGGDGVVDDCVAGFGVEVIFGPYIPRFAILGRHARAELPNVSCFADLMTGETPLEKLRDVVLVDAGHRE